MVRTTLFPNRVKISTYLRLPRHNRKTEEQYERVLESSKVKVGVEATGWATLGSENESLAVANGLASFCAEEYCVDWWQSCIYPHQHLLSRPSPSSFPKYRPEAGSLCSYDLERVDRMTG